MKTKKPRKERRRAAVPAGKPVAQLVPVVEKPPSVFGYLRGTVTYHEDIVAPTGEVWTADW
jgi:hypothetical protein